MKKHCSCFKTGAIVFKGANTGMYKELKDRTKVFFDPSLTDTQRFEALLKDDELAYMFDETGSLT